MPRLVAFNNISLDGYFADPRGDIGWTHRVGPDPDYEDFVAGNASGGGMLLLGRKTYEMMAGFWPTAAAYEQMPEVARGMNCMPKVVFSRTLRDATWANSRVCCDDVAAEVRRLKRDGEHDMAILGSGSIVAQLAEHRLIDSYQVVVNPVVLGTGRSQFHGLSRPLDLRLVETRSFGNGKVYLRFDAATAAA